MAKNVLKRQFSNMYGKDKAFQGNSNVKLTLNKNVSENFIDSNSDVQSKRVIKNEFNNVYGEKKTDMFPEIKPSNITVSSIVFLTLLLILVSIVYYYRNNILEFFKKMMDKVNTVDKADTVSELESKYDKLFDTINKRIDQDDKDMSEIKAKLKMEQIDNIQKNETKEKETQKEIEKGGVSTLNAKMETKYKNNQIVKGNGYCYIGFDNHMRECTDVYEGDICMSGQIFPTLDVCVNPEFRP